MEHIFVAYSLLKKTITALMRPCKNTKAMVYSPDGDTVIVPGVLQGDALAPCLFMICLATTIGQMKENGFTLKKRKKSR